MSSQSKVVMFFAWLAIFQISIPYRLSAGVPTDQVRATVDRVVATLKDPTLKSEGKTKERRDRLRQIIYPKFDFAEMARRSLGSNWRQRTPEQQREFIEIFTDLLEDSYVSKIEAYTNEKYSFTKETVDKDFAEVTSKIATKNGDEISIRYRLHLADGDWKIYDVIIENISLVNNYRSQFNRIIANSSYEDLIRKLKEKQVQIVRGKKS